jgi:hypothetical protein
MKQHIHPHVFHRQTIRYFFLIEILLELGFASMLKAEITNYYPFNRHFRPVTFDAPAPLSAGAIRQGSRELTGVVGPFPILTNTAECVLYTGLAWMQADPHSAWVAATASPASRIISTNQIMDEVGWLAGIRTNQNHWGAFHWFLQNRIAFQAPTQTVWYSPQGVSNDVVRVLIGSLGDFEPGEIDDLLSPAPPPMSPNCCMTTQTFWRADLNAYLRLVETRWVPPHLEDSDGDGIPDFADGFNFDGISGNSDDRAPGAFFPAWQILLPPIEDPDSFLIRIVYAASDPLAIVSPGTEVDFQPGAGALRLWLKSAQALRSGLSFSLGGDYLPPGTYTAGELGLTPDSWEWTLYLEMIRFDADDSIRIDWSSDGGTRWRAMERIDLRATKMDLVPDWNHDRVIDDADLNQTTTNNPFRFWINDDNDVGDIAEDDSDLPGHWSWGTSPADFSNSEVDGRCDLLDFFPVWLDLKQALDILPPSDTVQYRLKQADSAIRAVYTDLTKDQAGSYLTTEGNSYGPNFGQNAFDAETFEITASGVILSANFLNKIKQDASKGILMVEGKVATTAPLVLEIWKDGAKISQKEMPLSLDGVEKMYRWINLRPSAGLPTSTNEPANNPDSRSNGKNVFFLHGFNVDAESARGWNAEIFKRLYQSGSQSKFWGMTWEGDMGLLNALHYQENVANSLTVSSNFYEQIHGIPGEKIVMAHSLGNMVVSGAIQDYGLVVSKYFMLNSAVAAECYRPASFNETTSDNYMLHSAWSGYNSNTWCATWFKLFSVSDDRSKLTWKNRFPNAFTVAYNFYSSGDEVFEVQNSTPSPFSGGLFHLERHAWQKQEMFKGRDGLGGTDWAGWGFAGHWEDDVWVRNITMEQANTANDENLRTNAVFWHNPTTMFSSNITSRVANDIIAMGVPALSYAAGVHEIPMPGLDKNYDNNLHKPNGWGRNEAPYFDRWLHSDLKDMAFPYTHDLFDQFTKQGALQ